MIGIVMESVATAGDVRRVVEAIESLGLDAHAIPGRSERQLVSPETAARSNLRRSRTFPEN